jgi:hypothetical protein
MGIQIDVVAGYPINDEMERVLGLAEAVGEPVSVTFMWEEREESERAVLVPAATLALWEHWAPPRTRRVKLETRTKLWQRNRNWPIQRNSARSRSFVVA